MSQKKIKNLQHYFIRTTAIGLCAAMLVCPVPVKAADASDGALNDLASKFLKTVKPRLARVEKMRQQEFDRDNPLARVENGEELILSLHKGNLRLAEVVIARKENDRLYLSFRDFLAAMDFPIDFNYLEGTASGWFIKEQNLFDMSIERQTASVQGNTYVMKPYEYIVEPGNDILFSQSFYKNVFGFDFKLNVKEMKLAFDTAETLPVEAKIARANRRENVMQSNNVSVLPEIKQEYELFTQPVADIQVRHFYDSPSERDATNSTNYSVITANDFMYGGLKTYINGDDEESISQIRATWTKQADEGEDLGIGDIKRVQLGDITPPRLNMFRGAGQQLGVRVSNESIYDDIDSDTDSTRFEGDIQPGWDIEIYRNDIFIDSQTAGLDGRYLFEEVPLVFGRNEFRFVYYGPQGQINEETRVILRQNNRFDEGEGIYSVSLSSKGDSTYRADSEYTVPDQGTPDFIATYDLGVSKDLALNIGGRMHTVDERQIAQVSAGATLYNDQGIYELNTGVDNQGEFGAEGIVLADVFGQALRSQTQINTDFFDVSNYDSDNVVLQSYNTLSGDLTEESYYNAGFEYFQLASGNSRFVTRAAASHRIPRGLLGAEYVYSSQDYEGITAEDHTLALNGRYNLSPVFLRGRVNYELAPEAQVRSYVAAANTTLSEDLKGEIELEHLPLTGETEAEISLTYNNDYFALTPNLRVDTEDNLAAFVTLRFGLGADPYSDKFAMTSRNMTSSGGVSARVFLDEDGDGVWDRYEKPIPGVLVRGAQSGQRGYSEEDGIVFIPNFSENYKTDVVLDDKTFEDPYYVQSNEGNSFRARAGRVVKMDFPIVYSGEVDGTISLLDKYGSFRAFQNINVVLVDGDGKIAHSGQAAYDGFYVIGDVHPGHYKLMLDPQIVEALGLVQIEPKGFDFYPDGTIHYDQNFFSVAHDVAPEYLQRFMEQYPKKKIVMELGRYSNKLMVGLKWLRFKAQHAGLLQGFGLAKGLKKIDQNGGDYQYPLHIGPVYNIQQALGICDALKLEDVPCTLRTMEIEEEDLNRGNETAALRPSSETL